MTTESALIELTGAVSTLRRDFDKHEDSDKKNFKYAHNMLEDLIAKHAKLREGDIEDEMELREALADLRARLQFIERLVWFVLIGVLGTVGAQLAKVIF